MMPSYRFTGATFALGCRSTNAHTPVMVSTASGQNDQQNYAAFLNPASTGVVCVILTSGQSSSGTVTAFPTDGTPTSEKTFVLPPGMIAPIVVATPGVGPQGGFWCSGISNLVGTTTIFVTPCSSQS